ncbi:MAG: hypothetical protein LC768_18030 [Acidobacteria bacterium]|nr:hypothetical protein [Acidobacteriota bacterium]MCA1640192.1 hypothetical protein [Acidobacteriota bacterium]
MKKLFYLFLALFIFSSAVFAQKGIDRQTERIKEEGNKTTPQRSNGAYRSIDFGKGKTKVREPLANPYRMNARRDVLVGKILDILKEKKLIVNESASRLKDGIIVTEPFVFAKGAVITRNELNRYAVLPSSDTSWTRGRYALTIEVRSIDGIKNDVSVTAKVEGRSENGLISEWTTLQSAGAAEDEFLVKLVELITGTVIDAPQDTDQ